MSGIRILFWFPFLLTKCRQKCSSCICNAYVKKCRFFHQQLKRNILTTFTYSSPNMGAIPIPVSICSSALHLPRSRAIYPGSLGNIWPSRGDAKTTRRRQYPATSPAVARETHDLNFPRNRVTSANRISLATRGTGNPAPTDVSV